MGLLTAGLLAALQRTGSQPFAALTLTLPDSTRRWSTAYVASLSGNLWSGKLLSIGSITRSIADPSFSLEHSDLQVTIDDLDGVFGQLVDGSSANSIRGSVATVQLGELSVAQANWSTVWTGIVQRWNMSTPGQWELSLTMDDVPLRRGVPKVLINSADHANAHESAMNLPAPLVYGRHSSIGQGESGSITCPYIDTVNYRFMVSLGQVKSVDRVYVGGVEKTSGWSATTLSAGGRTYQIIDFTNDPFDGGDVQEVTADVQGYEATGDGSGTMISEPAAQLKHCLINFVFGDYRSENWATSHARVDATSFTTASSFCTAKGYATSMVVNAETTGEALITAWCQSVLCHAYWTVDGKVAVVFDDHRTRTPGSTATLWRWDRHQVGDFSLSHEDRVATARITGTYAQGRQSLLVQDIQITEDAPSTRDMPWSADFVVNA